MTNKSYLESGYVFAPYVPLQMSPLTPETFENMKKSIQSYYGKKMVNKDFYGEIRIEKKNKFSMDNYLHKTLADEMISNLTNGLDLQQV